MKPKFPSSTYADGLRAAARLLLSTANDLQLLVSADEKRFELVFKLSADQLKSLVYVCAMREEKIKLLRDQAQAILNLEKYQ